MTEKSITEQIIDEFIAKAGEQQVLNEKKLESLKSVLKANEVEKEQIVAVLKEEDTNENP